MRAFDTLTDIERIQAQKIHAAIVDVHEICGGQGIAYREELERYGECECKNLYHYCMTLLVSGIPMRYWSIPAWKDSEQSVAIIGMERSDRSAALASIAKARILNDESVFRISAAELAEISQQRIQEDEEDREIVRTRLKYCDALLVDDLAFLGSAFREAACAGAMKKYRDRGADIFLALDDEKSLQQYDGLVDRIEVLAKLKVGEEVTLKNLAQCKTLHTEFPQWVAKHEQT